MAKGITDERGQEGLPLMPEKGHGMLANLLRRVFGQKRKLTLEDIEKVAEGLAELGSAKAFLRGAVFGGMQDPQGKILAVIDEALASFIQGIQTACERICILRMRNEEIEQRYKEELGELDALILVTQKAVGGLQQKAESLNGLYIFFGGSGGGGGN